MVWKMTRELIKYTQTLRTLPKYNQSNINKLSALYLNTTTRR